MTSKQKTHPTPWRIEHVNVPLADTGDYDGLTKILAADGDEVAHWWNADDVEEALAERIVQAVNAPERTPPLFPEGIFQAKDGNYYRLERVQPPLMTCEHGVTLVSGRGCQKCFDRNAQKTTQNETESHK